MSSTLRPIISLMRWSGQQSALVRRSRGCRPEITSWPSAAGPRHQQTRGDGNTSGDQHRRAASLFGQFEQRVVDGERTKVDASGQKFTLSSGQCKDVLSDAGEFDTIKQSGQSTVTARVMREVQRLTKVEDCDCEEIDDCDHGVVEFRPGRPHMLAAGKERFKAAMHNAVEDLTSADDSSVDNDDEDTSRMDNKIDQLDANNTGVN